MVPLSLVLQTLICHIACSLWVMDPCCLESATVMFSRCVFSKYPSCMLCEVTVCLSVLPSSAWFQSTPGKWFIYKFLLQFHSLGNLGGISYLMISSTDSDQRPASHGQMGLSEAPTRWSVGLVGDRETVPTAFPKNKTWIDNAHTHVHANALSTHLLQLHYLWAQGLQLTLQKLPC